MFERLEIFRMAHGLAAHSAERQSVVAQNIANADTPKYRAKDIQAFSETYEAQNGAGSMRVTREGHVMSAEEGKTAAHVVDAGGEASPNGNTVSLEGEIINAADARRQHDLALAVYKTSLDILRAAASRGR